MEQIAPLAKILAEANGIEWRNLHGSGEGGLIVEGDILGYLSRIMSGEEEPPATPVDVPPPDWTGADLLPGADMLAPGMPSMDMLSSAGVDQDLAALVGRPQPAAPIPSTLPSSLLEEALEFELEDEQVAAPSFPVPEVAPQVAAPLAVPAPEFVSPAPVLGREKPFTPASHAPGLAAAQPGPAAARAEPTPLPPAPAPGGLRGGLGNLLSRLYQQPAAQPAPAAVRPEAPAPAHAQPVPHLPEVGAPLAAAPLIEAPVVEAPAVESPVVEAPVVELPAPAAGLQPGGHAVPDLAPREMVALMPVVPVVPAVSEPESPEVQLAEQPAEQMMEPEPETALPQFGAPVPLPAPQGDHPHGAVSFGTYLRREANLAPAAELRRQLTAAVGQDVPLALLVARAAARHAESLGLSSVAVQDLDAGRACPVQPGSLRDALAALKTDNTDRDGIPDLLVIDAGALDLDDLHLGHTVTLSVGRMQGGRAALTLNGDLDSARAAKFLANVAATLEEPIILVV